MEFLLWHGLIVVTVVGLSFTAGYYTALKVKEKNKE
tara:strand:+ start:478 stop:585 length:108 start_codon:yes stop_codon:yes gene_type:complete